MIDLKIKEKAVADYYNGEKTADQISKEYGLKRRTLYQWIENGEGPKRKTKTRARRKQINLTKDEIELILLMILECDGILTGKNKILCGSLEDRLLYAADELTVL